MNIKNVLLSLFILLPTTSRLNADFNSTAGFLFGAAIAALATDYYHNTVLSKTAKQIDDTVVVSDTFFSTLDNLAEIDEKRKSDKNKGIIVHNRQKHLKDRKGIYCGKERVFFEGEEDEEVCEQFRRDGKIGMNSEKRKTGVEI